jgi:two-component system nitrogen regulation response regulator GlnG
MTPSSLDRETINFGASTLGVTSGPAIGLTLLQHPDLSRVGQVASLCRLGLTGSWQLNRQEPAFGVPGAGTGEPLNHPAISRNPVVIEVDVRGGVSIGAQSGSSKLLIAGEPAAARRHFEAPEVEAGVVIELSGVVLLLLHRVPEGKDPEPRHGLIGESLAIVSLREEIRKVADVDTPVLIRGESGSGKELVARSLHAQSPRRAEPFVAVNLAAIPPAIAASMLFGHPRGAFTGAETASPGFFRTAHKGSLFLDEIGELPDEVQPLLLRAIREKEIQPVGEVKPHSVDVRVISATDADLEAMVERGELRMPLLRRLEGYTIRVPALRTRKDDLARLFFELLRRELSAIGEAHKLSEPAPERRPWLPTRVLRGLLGYAWPGNVAELQTVARRIALINRGQERFQTDALLEERFLATNGKDVSSETGSGISKVPAASGSEPAPPQPQPQPKPQPQPRPGGIEASDAEICEAMAANDYDVKATALSLGVSHSWFHKRLETCAGLRKAKDLDAAAILPAAVELAWDIPKMARTLKVSPHGLKLRITALKLR